MNFVNLDAVTRKFMIAEIDLDISSNRLYLSPRLTAQGASDYPSLLKTAAVTANEVFLADQLRMTGRLNAAEPRNTKSGTTWAKVPITAADTLAEGEFNRFYMRAVCKRAIESGIPNVVIYRAKDVSSPRPQSEAMLGTQISAEQLLTDLRANPGTDTALGLPPGPNSGLSIRLP